MHTLYFVFVRHFTGLQTCKVTYKNKIKSVHLLATKFTIITKTHGATRIKIYLSFRHSIFFHLLHLRHVFIF
jgi:hypothetical protein